MFSLWVSLILQSCENERGVMLCEFYKAFSDKSKLYVARMVGWGGEQCYHEMFALLLII